VGDGTAPIDQDTHETADLMRQLGQLARELLGDQAIRGDASSSESFQAIDLIGLEAVGIAFDADAGLLDGCALAGAAGAVGRS
jgi:hypothetical protein